MKNLIEYYYNINIYELRTLDSKYAFIYNGSEYIFEKYNNLSNYKEKYNLSRYLNTVSDRFHTIVLNRENQVLTFDGIDYYILLRINIKHNRIIDLLDVLQLKNMVLKDYNSSNSWKKLWEQKIDNFEYYIDYVQDKEEETREFYDYFIGMGEVAISYLGTIPINTYVQYSICHERLDYYYTLYDLYNPLNIVFDHYTRDISEYMKSAFINKKAINISWIIEAFNIDNTAMIMLISRLLFPTFFFDLYEKNDASKILITKNLINRMNDYESFIYQLMLEIKKRTDVLLIRWLNH